MKGKLGDYTEIILGGTPKTSNPEYWGGDIPWITPGDMDETKRIYETEKNITDVGLKNSNTKLLKVGDIVISARGTVGKIVVCGSPMSFNQSCYAIRPNCKELINKDYLYYLMQQSISYLKQNAAGAVFNAIVISTLSGTPISFPSIEQQIRIASILSAYDDLIENNRRRMKLLEESARLLYQEWFVRLRFPGYEHTKIKNGVPEGWEKVTALDAMNVMSGGTPKTSNSEYWDGEIPFYTPKDSVAECYVIETEKHLTEAGLKKCNSKLYPKDTVFITARGTVGNMNLAQRPMAMNQSCYALSGREGLPHKYLFCALKDAIQHFKQHASGAVFDAIIVDTFKLIPFVIPDPKIVKLFEESIGPIFQQTENLLLQNQKLKAARDILLPPLMNGEIEV